MIRCQIEAAKERCAELPWVECRLGNLLEMPYEDAAFDAVYGVQVLEYVSDLDAALSEIRRKRSTAPVLPGDAQVIHGGVLTSRERHDVECFRAH